MIYEYAAALVLAVASAAFFIAAFRDLKSGRSHKSPTWLDRTDPKALLSSIRRVRVESGMTREELSLKLGVPVSTVYNWESYGKKNFKMPNAIAVRALNEVFAQTGRKNGPPR